MADKTKKRVYFKHNAPDAQTVKLLGSFNHWAEARDLKKDRKGIWRTWTTLEPGQYEYRFLVDNHWENNPDAGSVPNPYGSYNSVLTVT